MAPAKLRQVTGVELNANKEPDAWIFVQDRKYFELETSFIKRTLRPHEWHTGSIAPPSTFPQRWRNDAAIIQYLATHTNIPVPRFKCMFEDDGAFYFCTELAKGESMRHLSEDDQKVVMKELEQHIATLKSLRSDRPGVPLASGELQPILAQHPYLFPLLDKFNTCFRVRPDVRGDFVFCHNDLGQQNILVDPDSLKITAIIDWEFGGFWPDFFEMPFWKHPDMWEGISDEFKIANRDRCRQWLADNCDEVVMPYLRTMEQKLGFRSIKEKNTWHPEIEPPSPIYLSPQEVHDEEEKDDNDEPTKEKNETKPPSDDEVEQATQGQDASVAQDAVESVKQAEAAPTTQDQVSSVDEDAVESAKQDGVKE